MWYPDPVKRKAGPKSKCFSEKNDEMKNDKIGIEIEQNQKNSVQFKKNKNGNELKAKLL